MGALKKALKSSKGGEIKFIVAEQTMSVRFLTEPIGDNGWYGYYEHYDPASGFYPCYEGECCDGDGRPSLRYLANVYSAEEKKVVALKLPKGLAESLMARCEKYSTMKDRWYEIWRTGSTMNDTKYEFDAEAPSRFTVKNIKLLDLHAILQRMVNEGEEAEDDEEDTGKKREGKWDRIRASGPRKSSRAVLDDDYEDDDEDEDDDPPPRRPAKKSSRVSSSRTSSKPVAKKSAAPVRRTISRRSR